MTVIFLTIRGEEKELENSLIHNAKLSNKIATRLVWLLNVGKNSLNENDTIELEFYENFLTIFNSEVTVKHSFSET